MIKKNFLTLIFFCFLPLKSFSHEHTKKPMEFCDTHLTIEHLENDFASLDKNNPFIIDQANKLIKDFIIPKYLSQ